MTDVVVIGANLVGLTVAHTLARAGVSVVVLDPASTPADVPWARSGHVQHGGLPEHPWRLVSSLGADAARQLHHLGAEGLGHLASVLGVRWDGTVWTSTESEREPGELRRSRDAVAAMDLAVDWWDAVDPHLGTTGFGPGLLRPAEGVADPHALLTGMLGLTRDAGVDVRWGVVPDAAARTADGVHVHTTHHGDVTAELVVFAGEVLSRSLDPWLTDALVPVREARLMLARDRALPLGVRAAFGWTTAWSDAQGHLGIAGCRWASPHLEEGETDDRTVHPLVAERLEATARRFFPGTGDVLATTAWIQAGTCDGLPLVGPLPDDPCRVACVGFSGNEAGLGVRCALAVAEGILTGRAEGVPRGFTPSRLVG